MKTSTEIRRENLNILIERYGSIANLNAQLGRNRKDATLSQIRKGSVHSGTGRPRIMGDTMAREIETKLSLGYGWMDADHSGEAFPEEDDLIYLRRLNVSACCGVAGVQNYEDEAYVDLMGVSRVWFKENISQIRENGYELITASGDSMEPTFRNGDLIVVDRQDRDLKRDGVFCVLVDGDLYVKRVQRIPGAVLFISDNSLYRPFEIPIKEVEFRLQVLGRVVNSMNLKRYD